MERPLQEVIDVVGDYQRVEFPRETNEGLPAAERHRFAGGVGEGWDGVDDVFVVFGVGAYGY